LKKNRFRLQVRYWPGATALALLFSSLSTWAAVNVLLTEVPDYEWDAGCFGTATGNLMGYWDRHGFPDFYTGPTGGGLAPLTSTGVNQGICSLWASRAGLDGRPENQPGHMDDYWVFYESTAPDPYVAAGRPEHTPDSIGDFFGLNQNKWTNLNDECAGNIDGFSFVFWDKTGDKRLNYVPASQKGIPVPDIPAGLRAWTKYRGYDADSFSQLADFNPTVSAGHGFGFADLKAEIDAGYPVLLFLQDSSGLFRSLPGMPQANPLIHGMLAYGYYIPDDGSAPLVRYKTSWGGSGDYSWSPWTTDVWQAELPLRGVIGYHPLPKVTKVTPVANSLEIDWDGPSSVLSDLASQTSTPLHWYVVEKTTNLQPAQFEPVSDPTLQRSIVLTNCCQDQSGFYRVKLLPPPAVN
jgi:hypothetical protein